MRFVSSIYYFFLNQSYRESSDFFWKAYYESRKGGLRGKFYGCILHKLFIIYNANIAIEAHIADKPEFPHGINGIFISRGASIGKNSVIFQQVTIGSNTIKGSKGFGAPSIGDNVYIGVGAKIIGGVNIGNNCRIGAGCVVTNDVPDNSTVVMPKPRIICKPDVTNSKYKEYEK